MSDLPHDLRNRLKAHGQEHVLAGWEGLAADRRAAFVKELAALDLARLTQLYRDRDQKDVLPPLDRIRPARVVEPESAGPDARRLAEEALRNGEVAALIVAGGQGSRLGFDHPKGMYPIGPVSNKTLFQIHAEKVLALGRRYGKTPPLLVMTSDATDAETREFFAGQRNFGLPADGAHFFQQGTMPALDLQTGRLLLEEPGKLFLSPNGHGGTLTALADSGLLERLKGQGVRHVCYFQVDNPLVKVADRAFLGNHIATRAEVSSRIVYKEKPEEKVGVLVELDGRCMIIEYSDLPADMARQAGPDGKLHYRAGSPAIHVFDVDFLARITQGEARLPFHYARKKVPCLDAQGRPFTPTTENALKFEMFIFDSLPLADRWAAMSTRREEEFEPLKNATGPESPETVKRAISDLGIAWLRQAGVTVPAGAGPVEVSPLYALDAEDLAAKVDRNLKVEGPTYLE